MQFVTLVLAASQLIAGQTCSKRAANESILQACGKLLGLTELMNPRFWQNVKVRETPSKIGER
ncbi:MAG: hypothetical protein ACRBBQ_14665 [Cognatishimia sp.]